MKGPFLVLFGEIYQHSMLIQSVDDGNHMNSNFDAAEVLPTSDGTHKVLGSKVCFHRNVKSCLL